MSKRASPPPHGERPAPAAPFTDVAGYEGAKAEIAEVVDFLRHPERYQRAGAVAPPGATPSLPPDTP